MALKLIELLNILLAAVVGGMYWGPWLALTISLKKLEPNVFLAVVNRLTKNMAPLMTVLSPLSLVITVLVLIFSYTDKITFYFTLAGLLSFLLALLVTVTIEVPIVKQIVTWTETTLPPNWEQLRDRWMKFHIVRVIAALIGLAFLLAGILF